ncbi:hypothetical protein CBM2592_A70173 [Cupriavidus taiwanensis]|nr:hypothetical protein CBM2588_A40330 [Cupriavidus taiwanensis]SOY55315.1 hypothetical protein CBM2592_A70173 [Cupriavidus taiwanensis]SOY89442.1 hypothetical protein CBM2591_A70174 [Cupriavidus taiwanensis]SOZ61627.1 hypothetical protein CBM2617_A40302 [Cupriavidus taiwanensis]SOZ81709.1 hypothetical protein CBM2618_A50304 [Cupriavidus taiwanensis]
MIRLIEIGKKSTPTIVGIGRNPGRIVRLETKRLRPCHATRNQATEHAANGTCTQKPLSPVGVATKPQSCVDGKYGAQAKENGKERRYRTRNTHHG